MKPDNSSYTVTSPDLFLSDNGVSVVISSTDAKLTSGIKLLVEKYIMNSIVFYVQGSKTTSVSLPWLWHVSRSCEFMILDIDTCAYEDIMAALLKTVDEGHQVIFYSPKKKRREAIKLINASSKYVMLSDINELDAYLKIQTAPGFGYLDD